MFFSVGPQSIRLTKLMVDFSATTGDMDIYFGPQGENLIKVKLLVTFEFNTAYLKLVSTRKFKFSTMLVLEAK